MWWCTSGVPKKGPKETKEGENVFFSHRGMAVADEKESVVSLLPSRTEEVVVVPRIFSFEWILW